MNRDVMLDLETMGTAPNGAIVQIGACYFDRYTGEIGDQLLYNVELETELASGFEVNASTIYWWLSQEKEARDSICGDTICFEELIPRLNKFFSGGVNIWSHATFDFVILMNHYNRHNMRPSFHYRDTRDLRTLVDLANVDTKNITREGTHHNALDDCKFQVKYAVECFKALKEKEDGEKWLA